MMAGIDPATLGDLERLAEIIAEAPALAG